MTETRESHPIGTDAAPAPESGSRARPRRDTYVLWAMAVGGVVLAVFAGAVADVVERIVPHQFLSRSIVPAGTALPWGGFVDRGSGIIRATGAVLFVTAAVAASDRTSALVLAITRRRLANFRWWLAATSAAVGAWFWWVATPFNAAHAHSYYHWVLEVYSDEPIRAYYTPQLVHRYFHDAPELWQGINWGLVTLVLALIASRIFGHTAFALALGAGLSISGNMLFFAAGEEDVSINVLVILLVVLTVLSRRPVWTGLALTLMAATRHSGIVVVVALLAALLIALLPTWDSTRSPEPARKELRYGVIAMASFVVSFIGFQVFLTFESQRWFLVDGRIIRFDRVAAASPRRVDDFTIYPLSGAYFGHATWTFPLVWWLSLVAGLWLYRRLDSSLRLSYTFVVVGALGWLTLHEIQVSLGYNVRYLTYALPLVLVGGWLGANALLEEDPGWLTQRLRAAFYLLLILAPISVPLDPIAQREHREALPTTGIVRDRDTVADLVGDRCAVVIGSDPPSGNLRRAATFVLRRPKIPVSESTDSHCVLIGYVAALDEVDPGSETQILWTDGDVVVFDTL